MTRLTDEDIVDTKHTILIHCKDEYETAQLKKQILENQDKAEKYESEKELNNGLRYSCEKLEQENKELKDKTKKQLDQMEQGILEKIDSKQKHIISELEQENKELEREIVYQKSCVDEVLERNQKNKQKLEKIKELVDNHNCRGFGCLNCEKLKEILGREG